MKRSIFKWHRVVPLLVAALVLLPAHSTIASAAYVEQVDVYTYTIGGSVTWTHTYDGSADPIDIVTLTIVADDVDGPGSGMNGEQDYVYFNGQYLGMLNDIGYYTNWGYYPGPGNPTNPDAITSTVFEIDPSWIDPDMPVVVQVEPSWGVEIETSTLIVEPVPNQPPVADPNGPYLGAADSPIAFDGTGSDDPDGYIDSYDWNFGDSNTGTDATPSHTYAEAGIYDVCLTVTDDDGDPSEPACTYAVVYDPNAGFVTGGGWIDSPAGAYVPDPLLAGKATFGFVSKYNKKGATTPTGQTEFQFHVADLNFHSSSYDWLVVTQGGTNAQFKGSGTINGMGDYRFMLWAGDDEPDTFRIRIWEEDEATADETDVYDNGFEGSGYETGQPIAGGSIVIHTKKK